MLLVRICRNVLPARGERSLRERRDVRGPRGDLAAHEAEAARLEEKDDDHEGHAHQDHGDGESPVGHLDGEFCHAKDGLRAVRSARPVLG